MIPLKKSEMDLIINEYNLNFKNPLNFLTQENSKKILNIKTPTELYDFFYRGAEFKTVEEEIEKGEIKVQEMTDKILESKEQKDLVL